MKRKPIRRKKKVSSNSLSALKQKTREVVHKWVRERDRERGCICYGCDGKVEHASHYFPQNAYSSLRYDVDNIWGSCARCNTYLHGNIQMYRISLVNIRGEDFVKRLEERAVKDRQGQPKKWDSEELKAIIERYKM